MTSLQTLFHGLLWLAYMCFVGAFVPQVVTNYRRQSTSGLSNFTICIYLAGYLLELLYVYLLDLPLSLKVTIPLGALIAAALAGQRFYYRTEDTSWLRLLFLYGFIVGAVLVLALFGIWHPVGIGNATGWLATTCWTIYQIPQVYKIYHAKSTEGFNPLFMAIASFGSLVEVSAGVVLGLPLQTIFNGIRGLIFVSIFAVQFYYYYGADHEHGSTE